MKKLGLSLLVAVVILLVKIAWGVTTAFHSGDALVTIVIGLAALEGLGARLLLLSRPDLTRRLKPVGCVAWIATALYTSLFGLLAPAILLLWLNQAFDASPGTIDTPTVHEKWVRTYKGGSKGCMVSVDAEDRHAWLLVTALSAKAEPIRLPCDSYPAIQPGLSTLRFTIHTGAFGLPWYDGVSLQP
jgi:hypothetical protein